MDREVLRIERGTRYSYEFLCQFFGGEKFDGIDTPEIAFDLGQRTVNLVFECDRIVTGKDEYVTGEVNSYTLVEVNSWLSKASPATGRYKATEYIRS